jgi:ABC-2 type transport system permease protein
MRLAIKQFTGITALTALEASRQPIFLLLTTVVVLFIGLLPLIITHVIGESSRIVRDSALAVQLVSGLVLGCFAATSTITHELRKGTLASILSKPVNRTLFFLAKFSGVAVIMLVYGITTTMATMLSVRTAAETFHFDWWGVGPLFVAILLSYSWAGIQNFILRIPFVSRTYLLVSFSVAIAFLISCAIQGHNHDHDTAGFGSALSWNIIPAGILLSMAMVMLSALAVSLATRLDMVPTFSLCLGIFLLGLMSDYLFGQHADGHWLYGLVYGILPNWQHFWAVDALSEAGIPWRYTIHVAGYVIMYTAVVLSAGLISFSRMEVS